MDSLTQSDILKYLLVGVFVGIVIKAVQDEYEQRQKITRRADNAIQTTLCDLHDRLCNVEIMLDEKGH